MALVQFDERTKGIGTITLNDPANLNAMSEAMSREFAGVVATLKARTDLRVLILTGAGRAFSAGGDLQMLEQKTKKGGEENRQLMHLFYESFLGIRNLGVPLIAAINGHAIGAGLCVASGCDIRVAAEGAKLGMTFTRLGLHPGMGATWFLPRILGIAAASELLLTARIIEAADALRIGLVSKIVPVAEILSCADSIAAEILTCGPESVRQLLASLRTQAPTLDAALEREALCQSINYASSEFKEGVRATIEKRAAKF